MKNADKIPIQVQEIWLYKWYMVFTDSNIAPIMTKKKIVYASHECC